MISRDHGTTWTVGKPAFSGGNECQAAQLGDGSIMLEHPQRPRTFPRRVRHARTWDRRGSRTKPIATR